MSASVRGAHFDQVLSVANAQAIVDRSGAVLERQEGRRLVYRSGSTWIVVDGIRSGSVRVQIVASNACPC